MSYIMEVADGVSGYPRFVEHVIFHGERREARGLPTIDAGWMTVMIHDVTRCLPLGVGRNVNRRIAAAEAVQLVGGFSDPHLLVKASPNFTRFLEDNGRFHGAYGDRIGTQLEAIVTKLRSDPDTRQGILTLWDPWLDNRPGRRDYPCTVAVGFHVRGDMLEMDVLMRSQDIWWGTPFDWFQWGQVLHTVATCMELAPGRYRHTTWSTHMYVDKIPLVDDLTDPPPVEEREWQPRGFGHPDQNIINVRHRARAIGAGHLPGVRPELTTSEEWYREQLAPLMG